MIVEDGTGLINSDSYVDVAFADAYFSVHPFYAENWSDFDTGRKEILLISASSQLDNLIDWAGCVANEYQAMRWPRYGVADFDRRLYSQNMIPTVLKQAVCEYALYLTTSAGNPDTPDETAGISELKIDVIQLNFTASTTRRAVPVAVVRLLRGLGAPYYASRVRKVQVTL